MVSDSVCCVVCKNICANISDKENFKRQNFGKSVTLENSSSVESITFCVILLPLNEYSNGIPSKSALNKIF